LAVHPAKIVTNNIDIKTPGNNFFRFFFSGMLSVLHYLLYRLHLHIGFVQYGLEFR
jgi:hypothetical protein